MAKAKNVISFDKVDFEYKESEKIILKEASFSIAEGQKFTLMGQNGAGKSTIFKLITGELKRQDGRVNIDQGASIAIQRQVMDPKYNEKTVREFFEDQFSGEEKIYDIDRRIEKALDAVNFSTPLEKLIKDFSGGQKARLLLASALIQDPDILLLDEPTNNLDAEGIGHLIGFLMTYEKTVLVISHDADFLNLFTDGVLYLDVHSKTVQKYMGDYYSVVDEIEAQRKREEMKNARLLKEIQAKKEKANVFAHKGGKLRAVAKRMREVASDAEDNMVEVRKEDKTINDFEIPLQEGTSGLFMEISKLQIMKNHELFDKEVAVEIRKNEHLLLSGPNGIGKTTLLRTLSKGTQDGIFLNPDVKIGYYTQDFSNLDFNAVVRDVLIDAIDEATFEGKNIEEFMRKTASGFLIQGDIINSKVGSLSEGQKGLVAFCRLVLMKPGLLILDEPTNHINFRHIPVIAKALDNFKGAMILISHVDDFVGQIRVDHYLDLGK